MFSHINHLIFPYQSAIFSSHLQAKEPMATPLGTASWKSLQGIEKRKVLLRMGCGCLWIWMFMDVYGCLWMFMDVYGCLWMFMDACGCLWMFVDVYGCLWMFMDAYGCL